MCFLPFILNQVGVLIQSHIIGKKIDSLLLEFSNSEKLKVIWFCNNKSGSEENAWRGEFFITDEYIHFQCKYEIFLPFLAPRVTRYVNSFL